MSVDNDDRAAWAQTAVNAFRSVCQTDAEGAIGDLLTNLCHLIEREKHLRGPEIRAFVLRSFLCYLEEYGEENR